MGEESLTFRDIEKHKYHPTQKSLISISNVNNNKTIVYNKAPFGFKYFIGYKDDRKVTPFYIMFPKWVLTEEIF